MDPRWLARCLLRHCRLLTRQSGALTQERRWPVGTSGNALKLSCDRCLVYDRPYLANSLAPKFIEHVLGERHSLPAYIEAEERSPGRAVEAQPARDVRRIANQQLDVEIKVRNFIKVPLQHPEIT